MKNTMKEKLIMVSRYCALVAAIGLAACGGNINAPYSIATSPTVYIFYPTEADANVCLTDTGQNEFPVYFTAFNTPANAVVRLRIDRHINGGRVLGLTNTSPFVVSLAGRADAAAEHQIDVEIVNADGSVLTPTQTQNTSHMFQVLFNTKARAIVVSGTAAEAAARCPSVVPCTDDSQCDPADADAMTAAQTCVDGACTTPE